MPLWGCYSGSGTPTGGFEKFFTSLIVVIFFNGMHNRNNIKNNIQCIRRDA